MKALDTNILLRYIENDDGIQSKKVGDLVDNAIINKERFFVSVLVVLELDWVLSSSFKLDRQEIIEILLDLMELEVFDFQYETVVKKTLLFAKTNSYDLSDLLIGAIAKANDCTTTLTFDKKASKSPEFELLV